ncbi:MAG TPA: hypothetical protein VFV62_05965, partial [Gaiellaceae bacterium]|nr:hypothetical protein [Gaiellaceae bacterium]
ASVRLMGTDKRVWLDRFEEDHDNLRAAMTWAIEHGRAETALRMGAGLWRFWQMRGFLGEAIDRLEQALQMAHAADHPEARADALSAAAGIAYWQADIERSRRYYTEEIEARRAMDDRAGLAEALYGISFTYTVLGSMDTEESRLSRDAIDQARAIFDELGDEAGVGRCEWALANDAWAKRELSAARRHGLNALEVFERIGDSFMIGWSAYTLALAELGFDPGGPESENRTAARGWLERALRIFADAGDVSGYTLVLDALALVALRVGDRDRAARLSGAVRSLERTTGTGLNSWNRKWLDFAPEELFEDPTLAGAWSEGERIGIPELVAYGLAADGSGEGA